MELIPDIKSYDWGKLGHKSEVAKLVAANSTTAEISPNQPYAEWWIGDHVSGPSVVRNTGESLSKVIAMDNALIGAEFERLPFLLKVLSIRKALSIQVHPSKEEAEHLFNTRPDLYKDPNHKPELAIALTPFLALCGFRPYPELYAELKEHKALLDLIGEGNIENLLENGSAGLKQCFSALMNSKEADVNECIRKLMEKFQDNDHDSNERSQIFLQLQRDFPNDVGSLSLFFLNIIRLEPGEAIFLPAKEIHAYLDGNCIECMACSDNVIRAGLTPKFKDVDQLLKMLNYEGAPANAKIFKPRRSDTYTETFVPVVKDFAVAKIHIPCSEVSHQIKNRRNGSIFLVLSGSATAIVEHLPPVVLKRGSVIFIPATSTTVDLNINDDVEFGDFVAYQAMYNDF